MMLLIKSFFIAVLFIQFRYLGAIMNRGVSRDVQDSSPFVMEELLSQAGVVLGPELHERYIELLCVREPTRVKTHLQEHDEYRVDRILEICRVYSVHDATAYLLERIGDVQAALEHVLFSVDERVAAMERALERRKVPDVPVVEVCGWAMMVMVMGMVQRMCRLMTATSTDFASARDL